MCGNTNNLSRLFETILKKKRKIIYFILLDFKNYFKAMQIKIGWILHKDRHITQLNKIESRNKSAHKWPIDFRQKWQGNSMGKGNSFLTNGL